ncbi:MAG: alpha/beta fold hydrolase [Desulfobacterales bacterium]|nr:alpha/beta fold hydrolase [Desulfobacterales bacterium]
MSKFSGKHIDPSGYKALYPFDSNYADINGLKYHYIDEGSGDPLIMLHGNPTWSFYYRKLITDLSPDYRAIVPDHIGCGLSDKPSDSLYHYQLENRVNDISALINMLNIDKKITLIVHDWGGMIGMAYAVKNPERIGRIVLLNTAAFFPPGTKRLPLRLKLIRHNALFAKIAIPRFNLFARSALYMASHKGLPDDVKKGLIAPYNCKENRIATLKFVQDIPVTEHDPSYDLVKETQDNLDALKDIPTLICWGKHDFVFDDDYFAEWKRRFPEAESHYFSSAGHYILEDEPEKISELIRDFLKRHNL